MRREILYIISLCVAAIVAAGCSTTKRLGDGDTLYTGVRKISVESMTGEDVPSSVVSAVKSPVSVKPNNPLYSPYVRTPIPTGLWAWNYLYTERKTGIRAWFYRRLAKQPVLIKQVQPEARVSMVSDVLDNHGYFGSTGGYDSIVQRNPKKMRLSYHFDVAAPWTYGNVSFPDTLDDVSKAIYTLRATSPLKPGAQYNIDTLTNERVRITNFLRNQSYYYFRPEYIEYLADTTRKNLKVDMRMTLAPGVPPAAKRHYTIGSVNVSLYSATGTGAVHDTTAAGIRVWFQEPLKIRPKVLAKAITIAAGKPSKLDDINSTLTNLNKLGIFRYVNMEVTPLDSLGDADTMSVNITGAFDAPLEAEFEADFASMSNSFIGPGVIFSLRNKNFFHGGEIFSVRLTGGYEWQTGNRRATANATAVNSYELGITSTLTIPRITPQFLPVGRRHGGRTNITIGGGTLNRPKFFTILSAGLSAGYDFQTSEQSTHNWTVFRLGYNDLLRTTAAFDTTMANNPAIAMSFEDQFIPSMSYMYTLDRRYGSRKRNRIIWQSTVTEAGNILSGIYGLVGRGDDRRLFGNAFSQFVKATTELKVYFPVGQRSNVIATRFFVGAGYAYGNSKVLPYNEQFYIGGANSIRAFTIRSIGPGSYRPPTDDKYGYFDQTGDFKMEFNVEYRFKILGGLNGAVFLDAGNIWLLKKDASRPGGALRGDTFLEDIALGTGVGLRYDLSFLVIRADLGIGIHTPYKTDRSGYYNIPSFRDGLGFHLAIGYPF